MRNLFIEILIVIVFVDAMDAMSKALAQQNYIPIIPIGVFAFHILQLAHFHHRIHNWKVRRIPLDERINECIHGWRALFEVIVIGSAFSSLIVIAKLLNQEFDKSYASEHAYIPYLCIMSWTVVYLAYFAWDILILKLDLFRAGVSDKPRAVVLFFQMERRMSVTNFMLFLFGFVTSVSLSLHSFDSNNCLLLFSIVIFISLILNYCTGSEFFSHCERRSPIPRSKDFCEKFRREIVFGIHRGK